MQFLSTYPMDMAVDIAGLFYVKILRDWMLQSILRRISWMRYKRLKTSVSKHTKQLRKSIQLELIQLVHRSYIQITNMHRRCTFGRKHCDNY